MAVSSLDKRVKTATKQIAIAGNITFKPLQNGNVLKFVPDKGK
jgi:hypothetical protein